MIDLGDWTPPLRACTANWYAGTIRISSAALMTLPFSPGIHFERCVLTSSTRSQAVPRQPTGATMKPSLALASHREAIRRVVASHRACNARVFGSVVHGNDTEASDLDILVDPTPETTLFDIGAIRHELLQLLGVPVDVLTPKALPEKLRASVLAEALPV